MTQQMFSSHLQADQATALDALAVCAEACRTCEQACLTLSRSLA